MKTLKLVAAIAALTGSMATNAANIDLFTSPTGTTKLEVDNDTSTAITISTFAQQSDSADPDSILGGYRDMLLEFEGVSTLGEVGGASLVVKQNTVTGNGSLTFNSDDFVVAKGSIQWDGEDSGTGIENLNTSGNLGDITDGGSADRFLFEVISADHDFNFSLALYDTDGSSVIFDLAAFTGPHTSVILFSDFNAAFALTGDCLASGFPIPSKNINGFECTKGTTSGIDFTHISAMELVLNTSGLAGATASLDMTIGGITTVPEPSSLALIGLGLMATGFAGKRKSKKA